MRQNLLNSDAVIGGYGAVSGKQIHIVSDGRVLSEDGLNLIGVVNPENRLRQTQASNNGVKFLSGFRDALIGKTLLKLGGKLRNDCCLSILKAFVLKRRDNTGDETVLKFLRDVNHGVNL